MAVLLGLKKCQTRREGSDLAIPNERQATQHGIFSGPTRRAEPIFHPAALSLAYVERVHRTRDALLDKKWASAARPY